MRDPQLIIQQFLNDLVASGDERGMQLAVYFRGELVIDAWAGEGIDGDTLFPVFSVSKGITATLLNQLVERGALSYDTRVADVWPEFAANGKGNILVRHIASHTSGLAGVPTAIQAETVFDWDAVSAALAAMPSATPPGAEICYHAITYGWLLGEILRRVDGRPFLQRLAEDICAPLGIRDLFIGLPDAEIGRVAHLTDSFDPEPLPDDSVPQSIPGWMLPLTEALNRPDVRRACMPASNGIMSARALARHYAALLPGGVDGVELLPPDRVRQATIWPVIDNVPPGETPWAFGIGYGLSGTYRPGQPADQFGHGGYGGAEGHADRTRGYAIGFTKHHFSANGATPRVVEKVREVLGYPD